MKNSLIRDINDSKTIAITDILGERVDERRRNYDVAHGRYKIKGVKKIGT